MQFTALLVHVLTHSETRTTVADAVYAMNMIIQGVPSNFRQNALVDTVTSGFLYMNKSTQEEIKAAKDSLETSILSINKKSADLDELKYKCKADVEIARKDQWTMKKTIDEHKETIEALQKQIGGSSAFMNAKVMKISNLKGKN